MNAIEIIHGKQIAEQILLNNTDELGLLASEKAYQQVWGRDSMIGGLGLCLCADDNARVNVFNSKNGW